jgi:hypothetical protein
MPVPLTKTELAAYRKLMVQKSRSRLKAILVSLTADEFWREELSKEIDLLVRRVRIEEGCLEGDKS